MQRRDFLRLGSLAFGGLALADVFAGRAAANQDSADTSVILLYLNGGPSHLETYDLKPAAPLEYRSVFAPIRSVVPGMDFCELFPLQARLADKIALVRSVHHDINIHSDGGIAVLTGKEPSRPDPLSVSRSEHPCFGAITSRVRGPHARALPQYVSIPYPLYMVQPTYLGAHHRAVSAHDPNMPNYRMPGLGLPIGVNGQRLDDRRHLRDQFDLMRRDLDRRGELEAMDQYRAQAYQTLASDAVARAFDISRESDRLRDRYGRHLWGQGCLLARRLAEAGSAVITVDINVPFQGFDYTNWDDHIQNGMRPGHFAIYMGRRLPPMDQALSALIEDIHNRDLERRILVVAMGEFGRTPRLSSNVNGTGRDHWPQAMSVLFSGGGLRMGQVIGATNARGEFPTERPYTPKDVLATIYRHLGIDPTRNFTDPTGRPHPILAEGTSIAEL